MSKDDFKHFDVRDAEFRNSKGKVRPAPVLPVGSPIADTHCHIGMMEDPSWELARAAAHGVRFIECMTDLGEKNPDERQAEETYERMAEWQDEANALIAEWGLKGIEAPRVRFACGIHPHNACNWDKASPRLRKLLENPLTNCIGEIGLDYHYDFSPRDEQREVFALQLRMAQELGLPVELHIREAHSEALQILEREGVPQAGCVLHCFNLGPEDVKPFVELGCHIALGGPLTFKKEHATRAAVALVPANKLLTETDAPYMAPEPCRGVACGPAHTAYTLRMLLDCMGYGDGGIEGALALMTPRAIDVPEGEEPAPLLQPDFNAWQAGHTREQMAQRIFQNALDLFDH